MIVRIGRTVTGVSAFHYLSSSIWSPMMSFKAGRVTIYVRAVCWLSSFGRSPMMSFDSRERGDRPEGLSLAQFGGRGWLVIYMIILKAIGGLSSEHRWVYSRPSLLSPLRSNRPIKDGWQLLLWPALAHSTPSAVSIKSNAGPTQDCQQIIWKAMVH